MATVSELLPLATFKKILAGRSCDLVDRLHHKVTVVLLTLCAAVVSAKQFVAEPIHCWAPAEYKNDWQTKYVNQHCWVNGKYFSWFVGPAPLGIEDRQETEFNFYIWVPLILLILALLFLLPHLIYRVLCSYSGINLNRIADLSDKYICAKKEDREKVITDLGIFIDRWLAYEARKRYLYRFGGIGIRYLVFVYLFTKLLYLATTVSVFFILTEFLDMDFFGYGSDVIHGLRNNVSVRESPRFPRLTLCDMEIRQLQNVLTFTIQCVLPINLFNEKIFVFLWFWLILLVTITFCNTMQWLYIFFWKNNKYSFVKKHILVNKKKGSTEMDKKICRRFAENYIGDNGCFLFRMMSINNTDLVVNDVISHLWTKYNEKH